MIPDTKVELTARDVLKMEDDAYRRGVESCKEQIRRGDLVEFQVVSDRSLPANQKTYSIGTCGTCEYFGDSQSLLPDKYECRNFQGVSIYKPNPSFGCIHWQEKL